METPPRQTTRNESSRPEAIRWTVTVFGDTPEQLAEREAWFDRPEVFKYAIFGRETCPETGRKHLQGFFALYGKKRMTALRQYFPNCHLEIARGTVQHNIQYCSKEGDFVEHGERPREQTENARAVQAALYAEAKELALKGKFEDVDPGIYIRHYTTLKKIAGDHAPKVASVAQINSEWHYGPTGTGKSRTVREKFPDAYIKTLDNWWDGYQGIFNI